MNQQDEQVLTIFERSKPGRRAAVLPDAEVPEPPLEQLIPARLLRDEPPRLPEVAEPEIVRHYNRLSRRNFDLDTGFYPLGSCTMKHNPRLNERVAALPGHARLHPAQQPKRAQGALELMWLLQESLAEICGLPHVSLQPSAGSHGELAGLLADPRLPRRPRRSADQGAGARHLARDQPGLGDDGGLRDRQGRDRRARRGRDGRPAGEGRRRGRLPDADQPQHARPVRREHRRDRRPDPRGGGDALLRRRQPQRGDGPLAPRRHGLRHRPRQPAQVVQPAARRRRAGGGADSSIGADRALPAAAAGGAARERQRQRSAASTSTTSGPGRSAACAASRATSASSSAPTPTSSASAPTAWPRPRRPRC